MLGLMVIVCAVEAWVITQYRRALNENELAHRKDVDAMTLSHRKDIEATERERDLCRMMRERYRSALAGAHIVVDVSDLIQEMVERKP